MLDLPDAGSISDVADWVELTVTTSGDRMSKAGITSSIESRSGREPAEAFITDVWRELEYRQQLYTHPCFQVMDRTVDPSPDLKPPIEYLACLLLSLYGVPNDAHHSAKLFERLTSEAAQVYLSGKSLTFGFPTLPSAASADEKESLICRRTRQLADDLHERFVEPPRPKYKDRGMDVVGWIPFSEGRSGQLVILIQCAAGGNWKDKPPVPTGAWSQYIHWALDPIKAYAVPCVVDDRDWHDISKDKGLIFDRIRIANLLTEGVKDDDLHAELNRWVSEQLQDLAE